mmetsp:Transcript_36004/g.64438  ORF Transcript_36004/g.64438 Transcript_36004/m.64438 type:complete len:267 (-) Transcript_36004:2375-3175(-)
MNSSLVYTLPSATSIRFSTGAALLRLARLSPAADIAFIISVQFPLPPVFARSLAISSTRSFSHWDRMSSAVWYTLFSGSATSAASTCSSLGFWALACFICCISFLILASSTAMPGYSPRMGSAFFSSVDLVSANCFCVTLAMARASWFCSRGPRCPCSASQLHQSTVWLGNEAWKPTQSCHRALRHRVGKLPTMMHSRFARVRATFRRRQSATNPTPPKLLDRTMDTMITSFSDPWKASTEATVICSASSPMVFFRELLMAPTCAA